MVPILSRAENRRGLVDVFRFDPEHRRKTAVTGAHGVDRRDADLRFGELTCDAGDRAFAVFTVDDEDGLWRLELQLQAFRRRPKRGGIVRYEIELRLAARARET